MGFFELPHADDELRPEIANLEQERLSLQRRNEPCAHRLENARTRAHHDIDVMNRQCSRHRVDREAQQLPQLRNEARPVSGRTLERARSSAPVQATTRFSSDRVRDKYPTFAVTTVARCPNFAAWREQLIVPRATTVFRSDERLMDQEDVRRPRRWRARLPSTRRENARWLDRPSFGRRRVRRRREGASTRTPRIRRD